MVTSPFETVTSAVTVPDAAKVVWVQDLFAEQYAGGAELTSQALIDAGPSEVFKVNCSQVTLKSGVGKLWIFGNFSQLNSSLVPTIVANMKYAILEYDYKFCVHRSIELHEKTAGQPCDCHQRDIGKLVSAFFYGARHIFWMSGAQRDRYLQRFPFLAQRPSTVLSSVFDPKTLAEIDDLRAKSKSRSGWIVLGSSSWIKGAEDAEEWCKREGKDYRVVWNLPYAQLLRELSESEGFVYLPRGGDTCPRMVIEAKLLGCKMHTNEGVQHAMETWFNTDSVDDIEAYLADRPDVFWRTLHSELPGNARISGYTTTYNCIKGGYPFRESIASLLGFCDEVVVADGGSSDGTIEELQRMAGEDSRIILHVQPRDWSHPRHAVFDGQQKALARALCTGEFCWQQDSDEVVHEDDHQKIRDLVSTFPSHIELIALPVVEFWGATHKVRMDINPWKWRLSRNLPHITHGIPANLRRFDSNGDLYSEQGTDGCDYIRSDSFQPIPFAGFMTEEVERARRMALSGDTAAHEGYQHWFNQVVANLPGVRHYSWWDMKRKIRTYRGYWQGHWESLYNIKREDTAENNMFFGRPWADVTDEEIDGLAERLAQETGGWIFHRRLDLTRATPHVEIKASHPVLIEGWIKGDK